MKKSLITVFLSFRNEAGGHPLEHEYGPENSYFIKHVPSMAGWKSGLDYPRFSTSRSRMEKPCNETVMLFVS